jgi:hypothetical protein
VRASSHRGAGRAAAELQIFAIIDGAQIAGIGQEVERGVG